jgi:uncharacterized protein
MNKLKIIFILACLSLISSAVFPPEPRCDRLIVNETFSGPTLSTSWKWLNEPKQWGLSNGKLTIHPDAETDFWSQSYYQFVHDNGHMLYQNFSNDENYTIYTKLTIYPENEFDQAGLMTRYNKNSWIKLSTEYINANFSHLGSVTTNDFSDWATRNFDSKLTTVFYRMAKLGEDWVLHSRFSETEQWEQIRIAHLRETRNFDSVPLGIFICAPTAAGMRVEFEYVRVCLFDTNEIKSDVEKLLSEL